MITKQDIDRLLEIDESFHSSYKLNEIIQDKEKREKLFDSFLEIEQDLSYDWFINYFQEEHADRKNKMQDFTPIELSTLINKIIGNTNSNVDICAGSGSLTIKTWNINKNAEFYCEELSERVLPFLMFNLAIRNMNAILKFGDSLKNKFTKIYKFEKSQKYSDIKEIEVKDKLYETVISNPPYSQEWNPISDSRFEDYELAPKSKADYAFLLHALSKLNENGTMAIILPHGVLFRGSKELTIRKKLIEYNLIDTIIGLPGKLFLNTDIPTIIIVLKKNKDTKDVLFIDGSNEYEKNRSKNILKEENINKIIDTYFKRETIERYSSVVSYKEIEENDFNLNLPRYVDTYIPEKIPTLDEIIVDMKDLDEQIELNYKKLATQMLELVGTNKEKDAEIKRFTEYFLLKYGTTDLIDVDYNEISNNDLKEEVKNTEEQLTIL